MILPKKILPFKEAIPYLDKVNIIVSCGNENYYREQLRNKIISSHPDFILNKINAKESKIEDFLDRMLFKDLFNSKRIFIIEEFNEIEDIDYFINNEFEDILILDSEKINKDKLKKLLNKALVVEMKKPPIWEEEGLVTGRIKGFLKGKNYEIKDSDAMYLYNNIGYDLYKLSNEL
jgi:DNA polymerase III delta subunit